MKVPFVRVEFKANFPWNFIIGYNHNMEKRSIFERTKIKEQFRECSNDISEEYIDYLLLTCKFGIIVVNENGSLRGFTLAERPSLEKFLSVKIICGDDECLLMMIDCIKTYIKGHSCNEWIIYSDYQKVNFFRTIGFEICEEQDQEGKIKLFNVAKRNLCF